MPAEHTHSPTPEEIMEYLDGEGTAASRDAIGTHLASCAACQAIAAEQRGISDNAKAWTVAPPPASLRAPAAPLRFWRPSRVAAGALAAAAAVLIVTALVSRGTRTRELKASETVQTISLGSSRPEAPRQGRGGDVGHVAGGLSQAPAPRVMAGKAGVGSPAQGVNLPSAGLLRAPMVIRTATLRLVAKDFPNVRQTVEAIVSQAGGFVDQMTVTGDTATARELRGRVRVPGDRMAAALTRLRQLGQVVEDTQGSEDVTDQIVDLDARLASARATELRLTELLRNRTGKLSDVLEVERELARVRLDIERLDAEKTNMGRRVTYATIDIHVAEERKAGLETGPLSLATRVRIAAADGLESAMESVALAFLLLLRAGPMLVIWGMAAGLAWVFGRRFLKPSA